MKKNIEEQKKDPLIYIYTTHQKEEYQKEETGITPTVMTAAYYLKEQLEKNNITTIVEETEIKYKNQKKEEI